MSRLVERFPGKIEIPPLFWPGLLLFGLGYLLGYGIGGDKKYDAAIAWALTAAKECQDGDIDYNPHDVAGCLKSAVEEGEAEAQTEARANYSHPNT